MTNSTKPVNPARHLSASIALQSATSATMRTATRITMPDVSRADPAIAERMRWVRAVLLSTITGEST